MSVANALTSSTTLKALRILEAVADSSQPVSLSDVAAVVGTDKSTAYRMLNTLVDAGYLVRDEASKRYRMSYKVVSLSRNLLAENEVFQLSRQVLERLATVTHETVHLCVLDGSATVLVQKVKGTQLVAVDFQIGDRSPLHCTSIGKGLLAYQDARYIEEIIAAGLPPMARNTITEPDRFRAEMHRVRAQGYAVDDHEFDDTMRCIAAPIFERDGRVQMGISISGPDSRFTFDKLDELRQAMVDATWELSERLGGVPWRSNLTTPQR
ncbi:MAG: IclR family transcriptional regulator [Anaerolineae bacterium]